MAPESTDAWPGCHRGVMGDLVYLLIVVAFFALSIAYARIAPRL